MAARVKNKIVMVLVTESEHAELQRLARLWKRERNDTRVGRATVLRELAMPRVRELLTSEPVAA